MNREIILTQLKSVKPLLKDRFNLKELALFGSYARNEQTEESDIDLLVDFEGSTYKNFLQIIETLEQTFKNFKVQVVSKGGIKTNYFEAIESDLIYA